ncbi:TPA: hypothetical protein ACH3X1_008134 [Trebouxia sp. C0004]
MGAAQDAYSLPGLQTPQSCEDQVGRGPCSSADENTQSLSRSTDFQCTDTCLKARGYKPFFRGPTLRYRDGTLIRKCARGEANKVVAAAPQAARATAPPPPRQQPAQEPCVAVAMDPSASAPAWHQF